MTMAYEHKEGWGTVFRNEDKVPGDTRPALKGDGKFEGAPVRLAIWKKEKNGKISYGVHMEREREREQEAPVTKDAGVVEDEFNDPIPF